MVAAFAATIGDAIRQFMRLKGHFAEALIWVTINFPVQAFHSVIILAMRGALWPSP